MIIDWSKAPKGTTGAMVAHFDGETVRRGDVEFIPSADERRVYSEGPDAWMYHPMPKTWNGDGLPPVGTVCEGHVKNGGDWGKYKIIATSNDYMIVFDEESGETPIRHIYWEFRPTRTAEQIAAEAREKAAKHLYETIRPGKTWEVAHNMARDGIYRAIDAGYGRVIEL